MAAIAAEGLPVDFLHSRLAPPVKAKIAPWMIWAGAAVLLVVGTIVASVVHLQRQQMELDRLTSQYKGQETRIKVTNEFVSRVAFAQLWHSGDPRYLACLSDLTKLFPDTGDVYATQVTLRNKETKIDASKGSAAATKAAAEARHVIVSVTGMAPSQYAAIDLHKRFEAKHDRFIDLKPLSTSQTAGKNPETNFSFSCEYVPPEKPPAASELKAAAAANDAASRAAAAAAAVAAATQAAAATQPATTQSATTQPAEPTTNPADAATQPATSPTTATSAAATTTAPAPAAATLPTVSAPTSAPVETVATPATAPATNTTPAKTE
jgi:hypothetical protein